MASPEMGDYGPPRSATLEAISDMPERADNDERSGVLRDVAGLGGRAAAAGMRPLLGVAADAGIGIERLALDRLLESEELERILIAVGTSERVGALLRRAVRSDTAAELIDDFFTSGLFEQLVENLLASKALWRLVDEIAQSPSVTEAISGQGLGFADQLGGELRARSRQADDWLERAAGRVVRHQAGDQDEAAEENRR